MAILDRFRRTKEQSVLPDEVNKYYQSDATGSRATALLLGIITLVVTLLIAGLLFFGGRTVYRHFFNKSTPAVTAPAIKTAAPGSQENQGSSSQTTPSPDQSSSASGQSTAPAVSSTPSSGTSGSTSSTTPATGDGLPATGSPEGM